MARNDGSDFWSELCKVVQILAKKVLAELPAPGRYDSNDLAQEALVKLFVEMDALKALADKERFAYVLQTLRNANTDLFREHVMAEKRATSREVPERVLASKLGDSNAGLQDLLAADQTSPSSAAGRREMGSLVERAFSVLSEEEAQVLRLRVRGLSQEEIATRVGITKERVGDLAHRATSKLRRLLNPGDAPS